jgi:hypothetical protein
MLTIDLVATSEPAPLPVYDRGKIMRRAWEIARKIRAERARKACDLQTHVVGSRIIPAKTYKDVLAETPIDLAAALKLAWAEAKRHNAAPIPQAGALLRAEANRRDDRQQGGALVIVDRNALAPLRRIGALRVLPFLASAARVLSENFISPRH